MKQINVRDLKKGYVIEEDPWGDKYLVLTNPVTKHNYCSCTAKEYDSDRIVEFGESLDHPAYAPQIFFTGQIE